MKLKVPPGTQSGRVFHLRGKGAPRLKGSGRGDMLIKIKVVVPEELSKEEKSKIKEIASMKGKDVRSHLK